MKRIFIFMVLLLIGFSVSLQSAQALRLTLKRIVFEESKRSEVLTLINSSDTVETYRLGWRHFRMTPDKGLVVIPDDEAIPPDIKPVSDMVVFAPRRFSIEPKSSQQVRIMVRLPADLPDGEYRSHLWIRPEADTEELQVAAEKKNRDAGSKGGVTLTMLAGATMPVIVRKGNLQATVSIEGLEAVESGNFISPKFTLIREGNKSVYGDIDYVCNPGADEYVLSAVRGIAVYTESNRRNFNKRIEKKPEQPPCRTLSVAFVATEGFNGERTDVLAEAVVQVKQ